MPTLLTNQQKSELALDYHKNGSVTQAWRNFKMKHSIYSKHYQQPCHKSIKRWLKNILTTLVQARQSLSWRHFWWCLDWTWRSYCLARQVSRSHTSGLFLLGLCQRQGLQDCCQWHRPPQGKKSKRLWDLWLLTWSQRPGGNSVNALCSWLNTMVIT